MFKSIEMAPADPILGLSEAFKADTNADKINLGVGVYKDEAGATPVLKCIKSAEAKLVDTETTKGYLPIDGNPAYGQAVRELLFGSNSEIVASARAATSHTPGGTGALRVAGEFIKNVLGVKSIWLSDPSWANHAAVFGAVGLEVKKYPYFDKASNGLDFQGMIEGLKSVGKGEVVLLHGCCHNPTGVDPTVEQWEKIASVVAERGGLPLVDFAYQGFGVGLEEDAAGLRAVAAKNKELLVCSSFSKNFGLYNERVGAFTVVAEDAEAVKKAQSQVKTLIRRIYSNPPAHGGAAVATVLADDALTKQWHDELAEMRERIAKMRQLFVDELNQRGVKLSDAGNQFIVDQCGMFSFSGLTKEQVDVLKKEHSIYIVGSGRINVAGISEKNVGKLCDAIAVVAGAAV
ncbi:Aspartate aminotransferase [Poriferisphaera corsica]|uniref:Aminotransferase n=1 Tax=Poriferisphaera corsica TaxID=2528020 RepID=A0A517YSE9_9BACT|nr:amino acid aminotransferase [Poriferisphaera corsica]QDU33150.1 Aspartate aminotransferase [Poriferisphaera corsica]